MILDLFYNSDLEILKPAKSLKDIRGLQHNGNENMRQKIPKVPLNIKKTTCGKTGSIRALTSNKTTNQVARGVIIGNPKLKLRQVGVPKKIAMSVSVPVKVTKENIHKCQKLVNNGPFHYPGANFITRGNNIISLSTNKFKTAKNTNITTDENFSFDAKVNKSKYIKLEIGDMVNRHLIDGDKVLLNRQPTLHGGSMMTHTAIIVDGAAIQISPGIVVSYNADFDGDEMNLHVPQTIAANNDMQLLCPSNNVLSSNSAGVMIKPIQDTVYGLYKLSDPKCYVSLSDAIRLYRYKPINDLKYLKQKLPVVVGSSPINAGSAPVSAESTNYVVYTRDILSSIFPSFLNIHIKYEDDKVDLNGNIQPKVVEDLIIKDGKLISGRITGSALTSPSNGIISKIIINGGMECYNTFTDNSSKLVHSYSELHPFSFSKSSFFINHSTYTEIKKLQEETNEKIRLLSITKPYSEMSIEITNLISKLQKETEKKCLDDLKQRDSKLYDLVISDAKGGIKNLTQFTTTVGQQQLPSYCNAVFGIPNRWNVAGQQNQIDLSQLAYITSSLMDGQNMIDVLGNSASTRDNLVSIVFKVASSGYNSRSFSSFMGATCSAYDGTVRGSNDKIIQYVVNDNGMHHRRKDVEHLHFVNKSSSEIMDAYTKLKYYGIDSLSGVPQEEQTPFNTLGPEVLRVQEKYARSILGFREYAGYHGLYDDNVTRILSNISFENVISQYRVNPLTDITVNIQDRLAQLQKAVEKCFYDNFTTLNVVFPCIMFRTLYLWYLNPLLLLSKGFTVKDVENVVYKIYKLYINSLQNPGTAVGNIAGQDCGAETTQSALDSHRINGGDINNSAVQLPSDHKIDQMMSAYQSSPYGVNQNSASVYLENGSGIVYKPSDETVIREKLNKIIGEIKYLRLSDIYKRVEVIHKFMPTTDNNKRAKTDSVDNLDATANALIKRFEIITNRTVKVDPDCHTILITLDKAKLFANRLTLGEIGYHLSRQMNRECVYVDSTDYCRNVIAVDEDGRLVHGAVNGGADNRINKQIDDDDSYQILVFANRSDWSGVTKDVNTLGSYKVNGINGIADATVETRSAFARNPDTGFLDKYDELYIKTRGTNLYELMALPGVDRERTTSDNGREVYICKGKTEARWKFFNEWRKIMPRAGDHHLILLTDCMLSSTMPLPINYDGINTISDGNWLSDITYERQYEVMNNAAMEGRVDDCRSAISCSLMGMTGKFGTEFFDLELNLSNLSLGDTVVNHDTAVDEVGEEYDPFAENEEYDPFAN